MALKRLLSEEMLQITSTWVDPKSAAGKALLASPDVAQLVPHLKAAHDALAAAAQPATDDPRLSQISEQEASLDARHDDIIRGIVALCTGAASLLGDDPAATAIITLRDTLVPDGLESVRKSFRAEAGQAAQLASRLTPDVKSQLDAILVGPKGSKKTLLQYTQEWISLGQQLGALEDEKARLQAAATAADPSTVDGTGASAVRARNQWIRVVNALVANADMAELDAATDTLLFGPLRAAEKLADRRGRSSAAAPATPAAPAAPAAPEAATATAPGAAASTAGATAKK